MHVGDRRRAERLAAVRPVTYMVFDLLRLFGEDLTGQPLSARRQLLERLDLTGRHWQVRRSTPTARSCSGPRGSRGWRAW